MQPPPHGVHHVYDRLLKDFAAEAPRLLLGLLGIAPAGADVQIKPLPQETAPPMKIVDFVAVLIVGLAEPFIFHLEFQLDYYAALPGRIAQYGCSLALQYNLPVVSVVLLLRPDRVTGEIPSRGIHQIGRTQIIHPFDAVRCWELDPSPVLQTNDPQRMPWAVLMRTTKEQVRQIAAAIDLHDEVAVSRFLTLGSLRYDRNWLEELLGGPKMGFVEVIMEGSSIVKEVKERVAAEALAAGREAGLAEGREVGLAEGSADEARRFLRRFLEVKFPGLESLPAIDQIQDAKVLENLVFQHVMPSDDRAAVQQAILNAAPSPQA